MGDLATPIAQSTAFKLNLVSSFDTNYDLLLRLYRAWWPVSWTTGGTLRGGYTRRSEGYEDPPDLWNYMIETAVYPCIRIPMHPRRFEYLHGKKTAPSLEARPQRVRLKVYGCRAYT